MELTSENLFKYRKTKETVHTFVDEDGKEFYSLLIEPTFLQLLIRTAKAKWKWDHHVIRWERRYGKKMVIADGSLGIYSGFKIGV